MELKINPHTVWIISSLSMLGEKGKAGQTHTANLSETYSAGISHGHCPEDNSIPEAIG